jgi:methylmalonyl-CoA mutase cobalamin-binding subunit
MRLTRSSPNEQHKVQVQKLQSFTKLVEHLQLRHLKNLLLGLGGVLPEQDRFH